MNSLFKKTQTTENNTPSIGIATLFFILEASFIFLIIVIKLFNKIPHGNMSLYSIDRFFFGLTALPPDQLFTFFMIFAVYWITVLIYTLIMSRILKLDLRKLLILALLLGLDILLVLSIFNLAVHNIHWNLNFNTYYDPAFMYLLLGIYAVLIFSINIFVSRYIIFTMMHYVKHKVESLKDYYIAMFFSPVVIITGYSFLMLRFNSVILPLTAVVIVVELLITARKHLSDFMRLLSIRILNAFQNEKLFLCIVIVFTLLIRLVFSLGNQSGMGADDSPYYADLGWRYASGENVKDLFFPQGYWLYLGIFYKIFGQNHLLLMILQSFFGTILPVLTYLISKEIFNVKIARLSAILVSINSSIIFYSTVIATESIYAPVTLLTLWLLLKARSSRNILIFISIGLLLGLSIIVKPVIIAFPLIVLVWMFLAYEDKTRRILTSWVLIVVMAGMVIVPITYRNYINHHKFILLTEFRQVEATLANPHLKIAGIYGNSYGEILNNIVTNPIKFSVGFIKGAPLQLSNLFWGRKVYIPFDLVYLHNGSPYAFILKLYLAILFIFGTIISFILEKRLWRKRLLPLLLITYYCAMYIFFYGKSRYSMPILPLTTMFGTYGFYYILTKAKSAFNLIASHRENRKEWSGKRPKVAFCCGVALIILIIFGLNYPYNSRANILLNDGRQLMEARDYSKGREVLQSVTKKYPNSVSAQHAYHDMIITSVANNLDLSIDIIGEYFLRYKGHPYTMNTFEELIKIFQEKDRHYLERLQTSSDMDMFRRMLDFQETVILNISYNYPRVARVKEKTCQFLYYLQKTRIQVKLKIAADFLRQGMPGLAEEEFKTITNMPHRVVFEQWFARPACILGSKTVFHKEIGLLYLKYGFHDYALEEFHVHLKDFPEDQDVRQYLDTYGKR